MLNFSKIILKAGREQSLKRFHPWVFSGAIKKIQGNVDEGDIVTVISDDGEFLGIGHYQIGSISVRIVSFSEVTPNYSFWRGKIENAWELRKSLGFDNNPETNVFRLVHAEGDGMPGLVVDFYNGTAVMQTHSIGMYHIRGELAKAMSEVLGNKLKAVYDKSEKTLPFKASIEPKDGFLYGENSETEVLEYGLKFKVDWELGQKTGFFIDQRENRLLVQHYAKNRDVLNMFCYTGGFSFYAMKGGAKLVHSVDSSVKAIDFTNEIMEMNFSGRYTA
jgi:23S rRNA (cytosine1962-C5)-methyltransferase